MTNANAAGNGKGTWVDVKSLKVGEKSEVMSLQEIADKPANKSGNICERLR